MNKSQLDKFLRKHTHLEELALKTPNLIPSIFELSETDCNESINFPHMSLIFNDDLNKIITVIPPEDCKQANSTLDFNKKIFFSIHPRFLKVMEHSHNYIEIIFVYSGKCNQIINGNKVILQEGDICFLDTNVKHSIEIADENDIIINCILDTSYFDTAFLCRLSENDILSSFFIRSIYQSKEFNEYIIFPYDKSSNVKQIMTNILCEYYDKNLCSNEVINCYLIVLFAELMRSYKNRINEQNYLTLKNTKISDIIMYLETNYKTATLESTAKHFYFNPSYLSTIIKKFTGQTFLEIIQEIKIKKAYFLLKNSNMSIAEIADKIGYSNMSFFYQIFKKKYDVTPAKFRKNSNYF
ncbi:AraC family transcriptional regulator [Clostridium sp. SYSU_GA19001]|uniref:AraC family transcriptional regulator n=1 Tax=Clostridium caldaquaticum TaxID=2940653 RepID=UPI0020772FF0|nr:AraC family transcriptional regulator [Clostridium caldaquaticum]MCM8710705.1 AraC family transcriptional regulator [Clostridium caldaquaticum]